MDTDEALYHRVRAGDMVAFDLLYERFERLLFGFLMRTLKRREDAEDVFHDSFLAVLKSPEVRLEAGSFRSWLFRIAKNACHNRRRSEQRGARAFAALPEPPPMPATDGVLARRELFEALDGAVERLPPALSELYHLRSSGLSYEEMANVLEIPVGTLKSRMNHMLSILREEVKPWTAT